MDKPLICLNVSSNQVSNYADIIGWTRTTYCQREIIFKAEQQALQPCKVAQLVFSCLQIYFPPMGEQIKCTQRGRHGLWKSGKSVGGIHQWDVGALQETIGVGVGGSHDVRINLDPFFRRRWRWQQLVRQRGQVVTLATDQLLGRNLEVANQPENNGKFLLPLCGNK